MCALDSNIIFVGCVRDFPRCHQEVDSGVPVVIVVVHPLLAAFVVAVADGNNSRDS